MARTVSTQQRALNLLAMRAHGSVELRRKLLAKGCPLGEVSETIERLERSGLLNDGELIAREVERLQGAGQGPRSIRSKLSRRGLDASVVSTALHELSEKCPFEDACLKALEKRFVSRRDEWDQKLRLKAMRFLAGRGYSQEQVRKALGRFESPEE